MPKNSENNNSPVNGTTNNNENSIEIRGLKKSFGKVLVLDGIDLTVKKGTMLALLGPNGAGKTTIVRILSTLLKPDAGTVLVKGFDVMKDANKIRHNIGLTGQYAAVDEYLSGRENLEMMGQLYHIGKEQSKKRAQELLTQFDLIDAADRPTKTYSGGMRRRLDLAVSLIAIPPIVFLDEPTTGLDPRSRITMWKVIEDLMKQGTTILLTTQYLEEADKLADLIAVIDHGKVIATGTADELKSQIGNERVEFNIEEKKDYPRAVQLIDGKGVRHNEDELSISVSTDGSVKEVKRILDLLYEANIEIGTMSVHKPSLDDVFLNLTGKAITKEEAEESAK